MRYLLPVTLLTLTYLFTLASFHPWDIALGIVFSGVILGIFRGFLSVGEESLTDFRYPSIAARLMGFPLLGLIVARDIARGTWTVAKHVVHLEALPTPGIVTVPIGERTRTGAVVSALATTLAPGSMLVDIDWESDVMLIHVLDATDPDEVRRTHQHFYDRYQRGVFP